MNVFKKEVVNLQGWRVVGPNKSVIECGDAELEVGCLQNFTVSPRGGLQLPNKGGDVKAYTRLGTLCVWCNTITRR